MRSKFWQIKRWGGVWFSDGYIDSRFIAILLYNRRDASFCMCTKFFLFRLYALPSYPDSRHQSLRSIARDTLANLMKGEYNHLINSYR